MRARIFGIVFAALFGAFHVAGAGPIDDGRAAWVRADYATAIQILRPLAEQGDAVAQWELCLLYSSKEDNDEAMKWHHLAAEHGHKDAQIALGYYYFNGIRVPQNYKEAAKWYRLAAGQGSTNAMFALGASYVLSGDYVRAHAWLNLAAALADESAKRNRDEIETKMTAAQILQAQELAQRCFVRNYKECD